MSIRLIKLSPRVRRHRRLRARLAGTLARPRLAVYRSTKHIRVQIIDDAAGQTLVSCSDTELKETKGQTKTIRAGAVGAAIAAKAKEKNITVVVFDRGG